MDDYFSENAHREFSILEDDAQALTGIFYLLFYLCFEQWVIS
jgi:hypothetical protein